MGFFLYKRRKSRIFLQNNVLPAIKKKRLLYSVKITFNQFLIDKRTQRYHPLLSVSSSDWKFENHVSSFYGKHAVWCIRPSFERWQYQYGGYLLSVADQSYHHPLNNWANIEREKCSANKTVALWCALTMGKQLMVLSSAIIRSTKQRTNGSTKGQNPE